MRRGQVVDAETQEALLPFAELGRVAYYRSDTLPADFTPELMASLELSEVTRARLAA